MPSLKRQRDAISSSVGNERKKARTATARLGRRAARPQAGPSAESTLCSPPTGSRKKGKTSVCEEASPEPLEDCPRPEGTTNDLGLDDATPSVKSSSDTLASVPQTLDRDDVWTRAARADPNSGRCLVTHEPSARPVHILGKLTTDAQIDALQAVWCYPESRPHLDDIYNTIFLGDTVRNLFNDGRLMLVPEPAVVAALNKFYRSEDFRVRPREHILDLYDIADQDRPRFKYFIIPSGEVDQTLSLSQVTSDKQSPVCRDIPYPFVELGPVESHVFPHFIICRAAQQWMGVSDFRDNANRILGTHLGLDKQAVSKFMGSFRELRTRWICDTDRYTGYPAHEWFFGNLARFGEGPEDGPRVAKEDSEGGDLSFAAGSEANDDDVDQVPALADYAEDEWYLRVQEWAQASSAHVSSQKVIRANEAKRRRSDKILQAYSREASPPWLGTVVWRSFFPSWTRPPPRVGRLWRPPVETETFSSLDWAYFKTGTAVWR